MEGVLGRCIKTGITPHRSSPDRAASRGQCLPYHTAVADASLMERSTCFRTCSLPLFSFSIITQPKPDILETEKQAKHGLMEEKTCWSLLHTSSLKYLRPTSQSRGPEHARHHFASPTALCSRFLAPSCHLLSTSYVLSTGCTQVQKTDVPPGRWDALTVPALLEQTARLFLLFVKLWAIYMEWEDTIYPTDARKPTQISDSTSQYKPHVCPLCTALGADTILLESDTHRNV